MPNRGVDSSPRDRWNQFVAQAPRTSRYGSLVKNIVFSDHPIAYGSTPAALMITASQCQRQYEYRAQQVLLENVEKILIEKPMFLHDFRFLPPKKKKPITGFF